MKTRNYLSAYRNRWIKDNYDRINLTVTKGKKELIKQAAVRRNCSVNTLINILIDSMLESEY